MIDYRSSNPQVIIRTAKKEHQCSCSYWKHEHPENRYGHRRCANLIPVGARYPEYLGEVADFQSGSRFCPACADENLEGWIEKA